MVPVSVSSELIPSLLYRNKSPCNHFQMCKSPSWSWLATFTSIILATMVSRLLNLRFGVIVNELVDLCTKFDTYIDTLWQVSLILSSSLPGCCHSFFGLFVRFLIISSGQYQLALFPYLCESLESFSDQISIIFVGLGGGIISFFTHSAGSQSQKSNCKRYRSLLFHFDCIPAFTPKWGSSTKGPLLALLVNACSCAAKGGLWKIKSRSSSMPKWSLKNSHIQNL